jgi:hypothetical protein
MDEGRWGAALGKRTTTAELFPSPSAEKLLPGVIFLCNLFRPSSFKQKVWSMQKIHAQPYL